MKYKEITTDYWFTIEPYVFISIVNNSLLLYNTLDGKTIESDKADVIELLGEILKKENCGVTLLKKEVYKHDDINAFVCELREKFMGDVIDVSLSKGKPVQLLPFFNLSNKHELYKKMNFSPRKNILENLSEISIYVDCKTDEANLISFFKSLPDRLIINIISDMNILVNYSELLSFFYRYSSSKNIICSYDTILPLPSIFKNIFSYRVSVDFPIDIDKWNDSKQSLLNQALSFEYVFDVSTMEEYELIEQFVEEFSIEKYRINPIYTGSNLSFFEKNVFLTKDDILSTSMTVKKIFANQAINLFDFGKITSMSNGDAYANVNYPLLGNIYTHSIHEIVYNEIEKGKSWLRIRNQSPCDNCVYQWICPSPSNYEIAIGRSNLCHVIK